MQLMGLAFRKAAGALVAMALVGWLASIATAQAQRQDTINIRETYAGPYVKLRLDAQVTGRPEGDTVRIHHSTYATLDAERFKDFIFGTGTGVRAELATKTPQQLKEWRIRFPEHELYYDAVVRGNPYSTRYDVNLCALHVRFDDFDRLINWYAALTVSPETLPQLMEKADEFIQGLSDLGWGGLAFHRLYHIPASGAGSRNHRGQPFYIAVYRRMLDGMPIAVDRPTNVAGDMTLDWPDEMLVMIDENGVFRVEGGYRHYAPKREERIQVPLSHALGILQTYLDDPALARWKGGARGHDIGNRAYLSFAAASGCAGGQRANRAGDAASLAVCLQHEPQHGQRLCAVHRRHHRGGTAMRMMRTPIACCIACWLLCTTALARAQPPARALVPLDLNTGELLVDSFVFFEGILVYAFKDRLLVGHGAEASEQQIAQMVEPIHRSSNRAMPSRRYRVLASPDSPYLLDIENGVLYALAIGESTVAARYIAELAWDDYWVHLPDGSRYADAPAAWCVSGSALYALENGGLLVSYSMEDGSKSTHAGVHAMAMAALDGNALVLARQDERGMVEMVRLRDGNLTPWMKLEGSGAESGAVFGIAYQQEQDVVYAGIGNHILRVTADGDTSIVVGLPHSMIRKEGLQADGAQSLCLLTNVGILAFGLADATPPRTLTLWGNAEAPELVIAALSIPGLTLESVEADSYEVLLQQLMSRSGQADVFRLSLPYIHMSALEKKGYYADLSASATIRQFFAQLYPSVQEKLGHSGAIAAIPIRAEVDGFARYDQAFFEEEGIAPPTTFEEMCGIIRVWDEQYAKRHDALQPLNNWTGTRRADGRVLRQGNRRASQETG